MLKHNITQAVKNFPKITNIDVESKQTTKFSCTNIFQLQIAGLVLQ